LNKMIEGVKLIEKIRDSLNLQEAQVILRMREMPYQIITVYMEAGKVVHKERKENIKD